MSLEVILKDLQATSLRLTCNGYIQNITQQNQTQLKFQRSNYLERVKTEWTFVGTLNRNLEISPVRSTIHCHLVKSQIEANPSLRNSRLLTTRSGWVTRTIPRYGTGKRNLINQFRRNQEYHTLCPSWLKRRQKTPLYLKLFSHHFHQSLMKTHRFPFHFRLSMSLIQCLQ